MSYIQLLIPAFLLLVLLVIRYLRYVKKQNEGQVRRYPLFQVAPSAMKDVELVLALEKDSTNRELSKEFFRRIDMRLWKCPACGYYDFNGQECYACGYTRKKRMAT